MTTHSQQQTNTINPIPIFKIFNNFTNVTFTIPDSTNNIYPPTLTTPIPNPNNNPHLSTLKSDTYSTLKIATHNIQGFNTITKQQL